MGERRRGHPRSGQTTCYRCDFCGKWAESKVARAPVYVFPLPFGWILRINRREPNGNDLVACEICSSSGDLSKPLPAAENEVNRG